MYVRVYVRVDGCKGVRAGLSIYMESRRDGVNEMNEVGFFFCFVVLFNLIYLNIIIR